MNVRNTVQAIPLGVLDTSTLTGSYVLLGSSLPNACFYLRIFNASTVGLTVSYDGGTTAHDFVPSSGGSIIINSQTNSQPQGYIALFPKGLQVWVKGTVGTGNAYLSGYYQPMGA